MVSSRHQVTAPKAECMRLTPWGRLVVGSCHVCYTGFSSETAHGGTLP